MRRIILASASPRRKQLLEQAGIAIERIIAPDIDESVKRGEAPYDYVQRMAREKLAAALAQVSDAEHALVIAADTIVVAQNRILPKAEDEVTARTCLERLSGRRHRVYTAVAMGGAKQHALVDETKVKFKRLSEQEIRDYLASGEWQGKAGGYAIQGRADAFIPWIQGSASNVIGLPLHAVIPLLK